MSAAKRERKPVGYAPRNFGGVTIYKSSEMVQGVQAAWYNGILLGVFRIGEPVPGLTCDALTLHPADYELVVKSELDRAQRDRRREWAGRRHHAPRDQDVRTVLRRHDFRPVN